MSSLALQFLNGLASASALFLVAAGLSLIFGVTRIVNFAHGSMYMLGLYVAYSAITAIAGDAAVTPLAFWSGIALAGLAVGLFGAMVEFLVLRRIYGSPELFQLLATFGVVLVVKDFALWAWGPEDILGPRAPGLRGSLEILGAAFPTYDLFLIVVGPVVLGALWFALHRTRWGILVRAATEDREMAGALGVNQKLLFTGVFAAGSLLAGLGGALQVPREPAALFLDLSVIADAFVVVVIGGMGSIPGAFLAALLIGEIKAFCIGIGEVQLLGASFSLSKVTLVVESLVMAAVLIVRPSGLLGRPQMLQRIPVAQVEPPLRPAGRAVRLAAGALAVVLLLLPLLASPYTLVLAIDIIVFALFAASLHFLMGPGGMASFGHAAYFGLGAYGAALLYKGTGVPMEAALLAGPVVAGLGAALFGWFCVRLSGIYLAMLTLAFAQITWSLVFQWDAFTGGSNGVVGVWPSQWLASKPVFYLATLVACAAMLLLLRRIIFSPYGYALRAGRDSPVRAEAIGIDVARSQWTAFVIAGVAAGVAGAVYAFSKGSISPETLSIGRSVDALVMVLLGGLQTLAGPLVGASVFTWLQDMVAREVEYWRGFMGLAIIAMVIAFPQGIAGFVRDRLRIAL
ncbi:MAG: ABC transporter permease [Betaproteobacteria bacterium RIFCSPLOWO2_02_FULL_65_24]|nr:MAG: ABC transporter permease [Betaproteobacteria bacterium RIFCSPLOWO2_02_FULL_65_24]OGA89179.1 MAG: ABC transporter permease [Betaproteobacteria bacterium RIFCSPLOWO2_12_FULL_66_14]